MTDHTELKRLAENHLSLGQAYTVAKPSVLLALIAENERLAKTADCWDRLNVQNKALSDSFRAERDQLKAENETLREGAERLQSATAFVQKLCDSAGKQPSVATGYLHDILAAMGKGERP